MNSATTDAQLLNDLQQGRRAAFDELFRRYYTVLCAYACRMVSVEDAEEIVQDSMVWLWENRETLVIESSFSGYVFKMVYRRALNHIVKREVAQRAELNFQAHCQEWTESVSPYHVEELASRIEEAVEQLPSAYRIAFVAHRFEGMSYKEIAEREGVSVKTIDYRIQQALKLLRKSLRDYLPLLLWL